MNNRDIDSTYDAACLTITRQAGDGEITTAEAKRRISRAERLAQCARYGVSVKELETADLDEMCRRLGIEL